MNREFKKGDFVIVEPESIPPYFSSNTGKVVKLASATIKVQFSDTDSYYVKKSEVVSELCDKHEQAVYSTNEERWKCPFCIDDEV